MKRIQNGLLTAVLVAGLLMTTGCDKSVRQSEMTETEPVIIQPIQGEKGDKGDQGDQGIQGEKGDKGDQGDQGIQGEKGDKGDQGDQGIQGEKGDKGDQGDQGIQGEKGDKGDQGDQGIQGEKGDKGDQGDQGIQGEKGDKGDQGDQGIQGEKGDKGDQGDQGIQGEKGDTGATGRIGFIVGDASSLLNAARVPNAYILLAGNITLEGTVIEASGRDLSFVIDLNGYELSGSLKLSATDGQTLEAIVTNGTFSATATGSGDVSLTTDEGIVDLTGNRQHWKTYAAGTSGVTVTEEAGAVTQTLSVTDGTLAFVGDSVTVMVNGSSVGVNPQTLTLRAGDTVTASGGICVFRVTTMHRFADDGSDVFYGLNWVCVGDSLMSVQGNSNYGNYPQAVKAWEMLSGQYAAGREDYNPLAVTNNMKRPYLYTGINCYGGKNTSGSWLAQGGTGYWKNASYYQRLQDIPHDADIVTIYGSINDWTFLANHDVGALITDTDQTQRYGVFTYAQHIMENDGYDTATVTTYAQYISRAIHIVHEQAPLAKVVVISPIYYSVEGMEFSASAQYMTNVTRYLVTMDYKIKYDADWLSWESWGAMPQATYDPALDRWTVDTAARNQRLDDTSILIDGQTLNAYKMHSDVDFAMKYVYDYNSNKPIATQSCGHMNTLYNELYFAPKFANLICDTLGLNGYYLPDGLKCNNLTYTK